MLQETIFTESNTPDDPTIWITVDIISLQFESQFVPLK
jgi:hypothetical protein